MGATVWNCRDVQVVSAVHWRFDMNVGAADSNSPDVQTSRLAQTRLVLGVGADVWNCDDVQTVRGAH